ncbi:uncharacterized protein EV154DRAFT_485007 [Mucor mucedo]|uniref:uncharacterized protein n=1 Tax=Mucor mucedo TaxID=29922 RepID=UPI0022206CFE|nr:uncharacterized protein EV154DRAFT_485007 [Mucor mucedo]KAI7887293.1 hypothetical protein EV154DRAFT_485007 [Mucor mucedo]
MWKWKLGCPFLSNDMLVKSRPALQKIDRIFNSPQNMEECYWKAKEYQRKASRFNEKIGYEVVSVIIDKMIKHNSIFTLSKPTPSEADVMIKIWADIFKVLFYSTGIYIRCFKRRIKASEATAAALVAKNKIEAKEIITAWFEIYDNYEYALHDLKRTSGKIYKDVNKKSCKHSKDIDLKPVFDQAVANKTLLFRLLCRLL